MNFINITLFLVLSVLCVSTQSLTQVKNTSGHDIIDGNCSSIPYENRVYYDHVDKMAFPLVVRSETVKYSGNRTIYCIQALNQKNEQTGGTSYITAGGVGSNFVTIELESYRGHGLEYYVSIYARNGTNATSEAFKPPMVHNLLNQN